MAASTLSGTPGHLWDSDLAQLPVAKNLGNIKHIAVPQKGLQSELEVSVVAALSPAQE